jgi:hypothetical protein
MTSHGLSVLQHMLPLIARNFSSLHTLALLRRTCKDIYENTKDFSLVYRLVLHNTGWINKTIGKRAFVLSQLDICEVNYIDCSKLGYLMRFVNGFPRGHLVTRRKLFELSLTKHGSIDGICRAYMKREKKKVMHRYRRLVQEAIHRLILSTADSNLGQHMTLL